MIYMDVNDLIFTLDERALPYCMHKEYTRYTATHWHIYTISCPEILDREKKEIDDKTVQ